MTMRRTPKIPRLLQAVLTVAFFYAAFVLVFDHLLAQVIPASLLTIYMFFVVVGVFMVFTFTEDSAREMVAPIKALVDDPSKRRTRNVVFGIVPLLAAAFAYNHMLPRFEAPVELRSIHPAPPSSVKIGAKRYNLLTLENPFRETETQDPERFAELVAEGAAIVSC